MTLALEWLEQHTRKQIYTLIQHTPGICIREIQRETDFAMGQLTYHLSKLLKAGLIQEESDERFRRFYPFGIDANVRKLLFVLRHESTRNILLLLLEHHTLSNKQISTLTELSPPTISWHMQKLKETDLIHSTGHTNVYALKDAAALSNVLAHYRESFADPTVDKIVEALY